ncbi:MAG TPA: protocatechuate 3,4-dioxygenase [Rickettsiales bacterium]|nr:protocatechuate 3,4-dioxygenase [Rickettsiales bacterium]
MRKIPLLLVSLLPFSAMAADISLPSSTPQQCPVGCQAAPVAKPAHKAHKKKHAKHHRKHHAAAEKMQTRIPDMNSKCHPTPSLSGSNGGGYPGRESIITSNNLALPAGKSIYASGQKVYVRGHVLDRNCVPISDAIVELWQANADGKYLTEPLGDRLSPYPGFAGSGRAVTDNLGNFSFITLFPGQEDAKHAPHLHFRITHGNYPLVNTEVFFAGDSRNDSDKSLQTLPEPVRGALLATVAPLNNDNALEVKWDVVLDGVNPYRTY